MITPQTSEALISPDQNDFVTLISSGMQERAPFMGPEKLKPIVIMAANIFSQSLDNDYPDVHFTSVHQAFYDHNMIRLPETFFKDAISSIRSKKEEARRVEAKQLADIQAKVEAEKRALLQEEADKKEAENRSKWEAIIAEATKQRIKETERETNQRPYRRERESGRAHFHFM